MPKYEVITKQTIERSYDWEVNLPVDMGASNERLADRMARKAADGGQLEDIMQMKEAVNTDDETRETIAYVYRDGKQVWPRLRKGQVPTLTEQRPVIEKLGEAPVFGDSDLEVGLEAIQKKFAATEDED